MTRYDLTFSADEICSQALRKVGRLAESETATANLLTETRTELNLFILDLQNYHSAPWVRSTHDFVIPVNTTTLNFGGSGNPYNHTMYIEDAKIAENATDEEYYNLDVVSSVDIRSRLLNVTDTGRPTHVALISETEIEFFPKTDVEYKLSIQIMSEEKEFDAGSDTVDAPRRWFQAIVYGLAYELSHTYKIPAAERETIQRHASRLFRNARRRDNKKRATGRIAPAFGPRRFRCR